MKIYVDLDGTFWDTVEAICVLYNKDFSLYPDFKPVFPGDINTWEFEELPLADYKYVDHYFNQPRFFQTVIAFPFAKRACELLSKTNDIVFVSIGTKANLAGKKLWLENNMNSRYEFIGLDIEHYCDKSSVNMSGGILIDDVSTNLKTSNAKIKICYGEKLSWNEDWNGMRFKFWSDIYDFILSTTKLN